MKNVAAVIVTYNVGDDFKPRVQTLKNNVDEIIVVDNGSKKSTISMIDDLKDYVTTIYLEKNKGIAYALNKGIEYVIKKGYKWILTLDHDSIVTENMINSMLECYENFDENYKRSIAMLVPIHVEENEYKEGTFYKNDNSRLYNEVLTEITSGALTKTEIYKDVRMYDEKLFIDLVDHDFCLYLNKEGFKIIQVNSAILIHNLGESVKKNIAGLKLTPTNHSAVRRYYMSRNRRYMWDKYKNDFPEWVRTDKRRFITENLKIILFEKNKIEKFKYIKRGINDYKKEVFGEFKSNK